MFVPPSSQSPQIHSLLAEVNSPDEVILKLSHSRNERSKNDIFLQYYQAVAADPEWLKTHPEIGTKLLQKAFEIIHSSSADVKKSYLESVRKSLGVFRTAIPSLENNVEISFQRKKMEANSLLLSAQSPYYRHLLGEGGKDSVYSIASSEEEKKVVKAVIRASQNLEVNKTYTVPQYGKILAFAKKMGMEKSVAPVFEERMLEVLTPENAFQMAVLAKNYQLDELLGAALEKIKPSINASNWVSMTEKAIKDEQQEVINLCINFALDQLPTWIADKDESQIKDLFDNLRHMSVMKSAVMSKLSQADFKRVLNELSPALLEINLEQCVFTALPDLKRFPSLYLINAMGCEKLVNISGLKANSHIKFAFFDGCSKLKNLMPLKNTPNFEHLSITRCDAMGSDNIEFLLQHPNILNVEVQTEKPSLIRSLLDKKQSIRIHLNANF